MKRIRIKRLCLLYFKGIHRASYDFGENITIVGGCNGSGKSTIVDAINWVLFGVDKNGNTKFGIKTRDEGGNVLQDVTNSATLTISVDGEDIVLERSLRGNTRDNGNTKNEYIYKINGEVQTAGDYTKYIDEICPMSVWKMCSTPLYFTSQDWTEQRRMLTSMFGEPDANVVSGGDKRFDFVVEELKKNSIDKIIKHLNFQRNEVQGLLSEIPTRIEELKKVLPQRDNWDAIQNSLTEEQQKHDELVKNLHYAEAGQGATVEAIQRRKSLDFAYRRKTEMETGAAIKNNQLLIEHKTELQALQMELNKVDETISALVNKQHSYQDITKRYEQRRQELESEKLDGAARWADISQRKWEWDEQRSFCPTCGQLLPMDRIEELKKSSQETFLHQLAEDKKKLIDKASQIKNDLSTCEKEFEELKEEEKHTYQKIDETKKNKENLSHQIAELNEKKILSVEDILASNSSYKMVVEQIANLEKETTKSNDNSLLKETKEQLNATEKRISELRERLAVKMLYENVLKQIENLGVQRKSLQEQLDNIDEKIANTTAYQRRACEVLEDIVNKNFVFVMWSMFRRQVDGTDKPWCECSVNGVPFSDLNSAMKINAGIDITNTLKKSYDIDVPCLVDNAETILEPFYKGGQQIRFKVTEDDSIRIYNEY